MVARLSSAAWFSRGCSKQRSFPDSLPGVTYLGHAQPRSRPRFRSRRRAGRWKRESGHYGCWQKHRLPLGGRRLRWNGELSSLQFQFEIWRRARRNVERSAHRPNKKMRPSPAAASAGVAAAMRPLSCKRLRPDPWAIRLITRREKKNEKRTGNAVQKHSRNSVQKCWKYRQEIPSHQ